MNLQIAILASTQERGDIARRKIEKRFLNSVIQGKLILTVHVIGKSNDSESSGIVWVDESFFEEDEPWRLS
ncbi:MAG: hypothetical protein J3T61_03335 [Candidatus Brocadiales bacterium]|nr:hypothetical protein [Candidatus Bathyanammoxibius sp.]